MSVVTLKGEPATIDDRCEAVALMCERVAAMARNGEVTAAAIGFIKADGRIGTLWESQGQVYQTIGCLAVMQAEMTGARPRE